MFDKCEVCGCEARLFSISTIKKIEPDGSIKDGKKKSQYVCEKCINEKRYSGSNLK